MGKTKKICPRCMGNGYFKDVIVQCPMCNSEGEIDEDPSYDYSGVDLNKLQ
jgi:DnaJ-class molecular chaperone